jgi:lysophospholipid acyltransferase (LPLAT)-like uncharacterized protein
VVFVRFVAAWIGALAVFALGLTCRLRARSDPRPALRAAGTPYIHAILHAHQIGALLNHGEPACGAMISRSSDGDLVIPLCRLTRIRPFRGSTRRAGSNKGGRAALGSMIEFMQTTGLPCTFTVDGPRGPRNHVQLGVAVAAKEARAQVIALAIVPRRRWIVARSWDRLQIPKPFTTFEAIFAPPIDPDAFPDVEDLRSEIEATLCRIEGELDLDEASRINPARDPSRARPPAGPPPSSP